MRSITEFFKSFKPRGRTILYYPILFLLLSNLLSTSYAAIQPSSPLTVQMFGTASGTVTSSPSGISCGSTCSATHTSGTPVTLTAKADDNNTFTCWGGDCYDTIISGNRTVTATFKAQIQTLTPSTYTLNLTKSGIGSGVGTITSNTTPGQVITCSTNTCSQTYTPGATVFLQAAVAAGAHTYFTYWAGCDNISASTPIGCTVTMSSDKSVSASFTSSRDNDTAYAAIDALGNEYAAFLGSKSGDMYRGQQDGVTYYYYAQEFTGGLAGDAYLIAFANQQVELYLYMGTTLTLVPGVNWRTLGYAASTITTIYNQYASFFGTKYGSIATGTTDGSNTYAVQWYNGKTAALVAWTDGNMYTYYNGVVYPLGVSWQY